MLAKFWQFQIKESPFSCCHGNQFLNSGAIETHKNRNTSFFVSKHLLAKTQIVKNSPYRKHKLYWVSHKKFLCLIWCELKTTVFTRCVFTFSESSCFNLKFGIKQSKIGWKFVEEWLPKAKISGSTDDRRPDFFRKMHQFKAAILLSQSSLGRKNLMQLKETIVLLSYQINEAFSCTKGLFEVKKWGTGIIFFRPDFFRKMQAARLLYQISLNYQVNEAFRFTKGLYEMKN